VPFDCLEERLVALLLGCRQFSALGMSGKSLQSVFFKRPFEDEVESGILRPMSKLRLYRRKSTPFSNGMVEFPLNLRLCDCG
jgi:hypothetical protein